MDPTIPITETAKVVDRAAGFGYEVFLAVLVMIFCAGCLYGFGRVVIANTKAVATFSVKQEALCADIAEQGERSQKTAETLHDIKPTIDRIDLGVADAGKKLDRLLWTNGGKNKI